MDITFILSAIVFTLLAIVVATSIFNGSSSSADFVRACFGYTGEANAGGLDKSAPRENGYISDKKTKAADDWTEVSGSSHDHWDVVKSVLSTEAVTESPGSNDEEEADTNGLALKYVPGMLRTSQMQMMMSKDELEEEQRVQQEQLAAIFQLLKDNQETFGDVSEGDIEDQLKLYSVP